jgi:hypothetical protein
MHINIAFLSHLGYRRTVSWTVVLSLLIVVAAAFLARATLNLKAALTDKPDLAVFLLLEEEGVTQSTLLRGDEEDRERDYLIETANGPKLVKLKKGEKWYVAETEALRGDY